MIQPPLTDALDVLAQAIRARMETVGWSPEESRSSPRGILGSFFRVIDNGFVATAIVPWIEVSSHEAAVVARVGLEHVFARDLLVGLAGAPVSGVMLKAPTGFATFSTHDSVDRVADEVVQSYREDPFEALPQPDVDAVIEMLRNGTAVPFIERAMVAYAYAVAERGASEPTSVTGEWELSSALLVAAGRYPEAELSLARLREHPDGDARQRRRFIRQMRRIIESRGQLTLPTTPARWPVAHSDNLLGSESLRSWVASGYSEARAKRSAQDAVRASASGRSRDELKQVYERELASRGLKMSRASVEETVDVLDSERRAFGTTRLAVKLAKEVHALFTAAKLAASDETEPLLLRIPDRAAYPLFGNADQWTTTELDRSLFDQVWRSHLVGFGRTRDVEVWLRTDKSCAGDSVTVHIGDQRVGRIVGEDSERFRPVLVAAAERDEDPLTVGRLSVSGSAQSFALDVPLPAASPEAG